MRLLVLLLVVLAGAFFVTRYLLTRDQRALGGRWGARAAYSLAVAALVLLAAFVIATSTTWRFF